MIALCASFFAGHVALALPGAQGSPAGSKGLSFNMAQNVWTLALFLGTMKANWTFSTHKDEILETSGQFNFHTNKHYHQTSSFLVGPWKCFSCDTTSIPLPPATPPALEYVEARWVPCQKLLRWVERGMLWDRFEDFGEIQPPNLSRMMILVVMWKLPERWSLLPLNSKKDLV